MILKYIPRLFVIVNFKNFFVTPVQDMELA